MLPSAQCWPLHLWLSSTATSELSRLRKPSSFCQVPKFALKRNLPQVIVLLQTEPDDSLRQFPAFMFPATFTSLPGPAAGIYPLIWKLIWSSVMAHKLSFCFIRPGVSRPSPPEPSCLPLGDLLTSQCPPSPTFFSDCEDRGHKVDLNVLVSLTCSLSWWWI